MVTPTAVAAGPVTLRPWRPDEATLYIDLRDESVFTFTTEARDLGSAQCRNNIAAAHTDPFHAPFAICDTHDRPVGNLAVVKRGSRAVVSYWLAQEVRGRGWASEAVRAATPWAFDTWDVSELEMEIDATNVASVRVAEAAGYLRHGTRLESACGGEALVYRLGRTAPLS
ncbi:GNAT family N-acetyltransferase [soil metagenome]